MQPEFIPESCRDGSTLYAPDNDADLIEPQAGDISEIEVRCHPSLPKYARSRASKSLYSKRSYSSARVIMFPKMSRW